MTYEIAGSDILNYPTGVGFVRIYIYYIHVDGLIKHFYYQVTKVDIIYLMKYHEYTYIYLSH